MTEHSTPSSPASPSPTLRDVLAALRAATSASVREPAEIAHAGAGAQRAFNDLLARVAAHAESGAW